MAKIPKIWKVIGISLVIVILIITFIIIKNYMEGHSCRDCIVDRTLLGEGYNGWNKYQKKCENFQSSKDSALNCLAKASSSIERNASIAESRIKVPFLRISNTIIASRNLPAYVIKSEGCKPSFAADFEGNIYSTGGCLG